MGNDDDDIDRAKILARRVQWIAMAVSVVGTSACEAPRSDGSPDAGSTTATAARGADTARPTACLSYGDGCPAGSVFLLATGAGVARR